MRSPYVRYPTRHKCTLNFLRYIRGINDALRRALIGRAGRAGCRIG